MSLGDGLARALIKYQRAKEQFGLKALLLGEADLSTLNRYPMPGNTASGGNGNGRKPDNATLGQQAASRAIVPAAADKAPVSSADTRAKVLRRPNPLYESMAAVKRAPYKVKCPECQSDLSFSEGCVKCNNCGYSQC